MAKIVVLDIVRATDEHVRFVIDNLHPSDEREVKAFGLPVDCAIKISIEFADQVWVALSPDGPVCMWGITKAKTLLGAASAWLLTTKLIDKYSRAFLRQVRPHIKEIVDETGYLENFIDSRHERALKFFEWLGFQIEPESGILIGPQRIPFHKVCYRSLHGY